MTTRTTSKPLSTGRVRCPRCGRFTKFHPGVPGLGTYALHYWPNGLRSLRLAGVARTHCANSGAEVPESATVYYNRERGY